VAQLVAQIDFTFQADVPEDPYDFVYVLLAPLFKNGQLTGEPVITFMSQTVVRTYALVPQQDALEEKHFSEWGRRGLEKLRTIGCSWDWQILGEPCEANTWESAKYLVLFARQFDGPVGDQDGTPVATYMLPLTDLEKEGLDAWSGYYNAADVLWLGCGELEVAAYKQLADPNSELAEKGRRLCRSIAEKTGKPTYYFLMHYAGDPEREGDRLCPGCGGKWFVSEREIGNFWNFSFRCDPCALVSNWADSFDENPELLAIGEWIAKA
jgi:predicted  nucleic acid-binding Zn ribbon protein